MIEHLRVQNFRRHKDYVVDFKPGTTIITGPNGSGKTSLIEAIYIALRGKSWRSGFSDILRAGNSVGNKSNNPTWWRVDVVVDGELRVVKYDEVTNEKTFEIDGKSYTRLPVSAKKPVVLFEPNDLNLLYGSPSGRRAFIDDFISQIEPEYTTTLRRYERVLTQRNNLLKQGASRDELFPWDLQFADLATQITSKRQLWIDKVNNYIEKYSNNISNQSHQLQLNYNYRQQDTTQSILSNLHSQYTNDIYLHTTQVGPHRHDLGVILNKRNTKQLSFGENKTIISALYFSKIELLFDETQNYPMIFLDDTFGELDTQRQESIIRISTTHPQSFITRASGSDLAINHQELD